MSGILPKILLDSSFLFVLIASNWTLINEFSINIIEPPVFLTAFNWTCSLGSFPIFLIILRGGSRARKTRASFLIAIYTLFGSIFMLYNK